MAANRQVCSLSSRVLVIETMPGSPGNIRVGGDGLMATAYQASSSGCFRCKLRTINARAVESGGGD
jgi:hypothetical protein